MPTSGLSRASCSLVPSLSSNLVIDSSMREVEALNRETEKDVRDTMRETESRIEDDMTKLEERLSKRLQEALDNPLVGN